MVSAEEKLQHWEKKTSPRTNLSNINITKGMLGLNLSFCGQRAMSS
jgi:hypothetical protein